MAVRRGSWPPTLPVEGDVNLREKKLRGKEPPNSIVAGAAADLVRALGIATLRLDAGGRVLELNPAAAALLGVTAAEACGQPFSSVFRACSTAEMEALSRSEGHPIALLVRPDGAELSVREWRIPVRTGGSWVVVEDITELTALRREQEWLTFHDPVTGLPNRRALERQLTAAFRAVRDRGERYAFGYLDVDELTEIVETFGQTAGDEILRQIAERVRRRLAPGDLLAHLGEVRFGLLLEVGSDEADANARAHEIRRAIAESPFAWHQDLFHLGAAVGMTPIAAGTSGLEAILASAEAAASMAKEQTVAIHAFDANNSIDLDLADHYGDLRWLARIHRALKQGRFQLYRQPIVPATGAGDRMYEVLLRMKKEDGSIVLPGRFIPAAERFRLIATLDRWVVRNAMTLLRQEPEAVTIAINLSGQSLSDSRFLDDVVAVLESSGVSPSRVAFEITETAAVDSLRRARRFIRTLRALGCRFVLDDFGKGLSSFAYLQDLQVDFIKIDGAFVQGMATSRIDHAIVTAIHQVANVLGIRTIAEFVENDRVRQAVAELGVDLVQGFGIGMPEPWLLAGREDADFDPPA